MKFLRICGLLVALLSLCCSKSNPTQPANTQNLAASSDKPKYEPKLLEWTEPPMIENEPLLKKAWQQFTADGRYRLVGLSDMNYSESFKKELTQTQGSWQAEHGPYGGLAALVVDTKQEGDERFGVVIFRGIGKTYPYSRYEKYWLYKDKDLSNAAIHRVSGYLSLRQYINGEVKICDIEWDERTHRFVCK